MMLNRNKNYKIRFTKIATSTFKNKGTIYTVREINLDFWEMMFGWEREEKKGVSKMKGKGKKDIVSAKKDAVGTSCISGIFLSVARDSLGTSWIPPQSP